MNWNELRGRWHEDPEWVATLEQEYPHRRVADAVVALRVQHRLTQAQLAERANVQQSVISRLESGKHPCRVDLLDRIAAAVGAVWQPAFVDREASGADQPEAEVAEPAMILSEPVLVELSGYRRVTRIAEYRPGPASLISSPAQSYSPFDKPAAEEEYACAVMVG
jgi:transcriptional regulator with XRE-family HTH domain